MPEIERPDFNDEEFFEKWCHIGPRTLNFDNETNFCSQDLLSNVLESKVSFNCVKNVSSWTVVVFF